MEVCLFEKKELFFITKITEFRDGAGFPFKTIEIGKAERPRAPPQVQAKKENPALAANMKRLPPSQTGAPKQVSSGAGRLPAGNAQKAVSGDTTKQVSGNAAKKLAAQDAFCLPAGKKKN
ncbi:hypothetical protein [Methanimicrococcus hacksteinii]|nr:hypothetical protein [Methanimicrococcus sp. At1]